MPTALIVGASRGIGLEFTRQYLAEGWRVFGTFRAEADRVRLREDSAGGTVITDAEGHNRLRIDAGGPLGFERVGRGDDLYILLGGGETYDRARDVVWVDFFANPDNRVNGLTAAEVAAEAVVFPPPAQVTQPTTAQFLNAAKGRRAGRSARFGHST